jgi:putative transposase
MKAVADTLQVARSNLVEQAKRGGSRPRPPYRKAGDAELLAPHTGRGRQRPHDGEIATAVSNRRWAADVFEIPCWNGDAVRVAFAIDTHDREVLAWTSPCGIGGIVVRDLTLLAVERRFCALGTRYPVEWLADNGSCFTAHETVAFAHAVLHARAQPAVQRHRRGFVKTFKRDYVRLSARPDATALLAELDRWFEDYNEMHPHRALGMRSPRQFIRACQPAACPV